ncbi:MAG: molybdopterin-dependent oxidoreductase [Dehalococcoidales bacterium]|nr:molybdopterin-dependent oxidoreductase [Dehalococcoidales bacterium]
MAKKIPESKTVVKSFSQCSFTRNGDPASVDVKDGRIVRIRPLHYDEKYTRDQLAPWRIEQDGKVLEPLMKSQLAPYALAYKKRAYSPNRIKYPLKRVDWDPNGERNPQNRGKSKYKRISWDEATTIIAGEIRRIRAKYGPFAVLCHGDGHGETKTVHGPHSCNMLCMEKAGGYTQAVRNADSWEGWYWGAEHVWGNGVQGHPMPADNLMVDITRHSNMLIHIGADLETTPWGFAGQFASQVVFFWQSLGKRQVFISPDLNYSAGIHADKWIPILPNTDAALQLAIAYTWITEGTYDKKYVETHVVGFEKFSDYVTGKEDGIPKTPEWASEKTGISEWTIKALAREWAGNVTSTLHYYGGSYIRGPYSHEPARLECCLMGMQGLGKPGVHSYSKLGDGLSQVDLPRPVKMLDLARIRNEVWSGRPLLNLTKQIIPKTLLHQAILDPPVSHWGSTSLYALVEDQFKHYQYPIPKEEGGSEIHMIWMDNPCRSTCWNSAFKTHDAFRSPKIETIVVQHPWLENDAILADIILPTNTKLEEDDFSMISIGVPMKGIAFEKKAIEPIGESKSDYEAAGEVAKKLGVYEEYTSGKTVLDKIKEGWEKCGVAELVSWEKLNENDYFIIPTTTDWEKAPAGMKLFYEDPVRYPLATPSGKLEFYSGRLAEHFPDDTERPPIPKWIEKGPSHDERLSSERAKRYTLLMMANHPRWRTHAQNDDIDWTREIATCKVRAYDGYLYEPVWINPADAEKRGIQSGDIVRVYNERGSVLGGAIVWERIIRGAVSMDHGARADIIVTEDGQFIDRGGASNLISPENGTSQNCWGMATSGYLCEVERVSMAQMEEWKKKYPEAFKREYDAASGLRFNAWVEGEN